MRTIVTKELKEVREAADRDLAAARAHNRNDTACIADALGVEILRVRDDDARPRAVAMAMNKTWAAAEDRLDTHVGAVFARPGQPGFGVNSEHSGEPFLLPSELSIIADSVVVGCVSVRGADLEVGAAVSVAAKTALPDVM
jgi:uncharacterized protein GlcG (DUF336 family)